MKRFLGWSLFVIGSVAFCVALTVIAKGQPASVAQTSVAPTELTLKVTPSELDLISEGLQTQPFGKVVPLMNKLRQQIVDQQPKPVEAPK